MSCLQPKMSSMNLRKFPTKLTESTKKRGGTEEIRGRDPRPSSDAQWHCTGIRKTDGRMKEARARGDGEKTKRKRKSESTCGQEAPPPKRPDLGKSLSSTFKDKSSIKNEWLSPSPLPLSRLSRTMSTAAPRFGASHWSFANREAGTYKDKVAYQGGV